MLRDVCAADHVVRFTRPSPSVFAYCKQSKTGAGEGLGMRLIGLQDERSLMKANVLDTALANGRSSVFSSTGKAAYRFSDVLLYI